MARKKRAIALAGGGPAAGLHIGALAALEDAGIEFDVFALSCIGAWVGIVYNTRTGDNKAQQTFKFFDDNCFRADDSYAWFPINRGFGTDVPALLSAWAKFPFLPDLQWSKLFSPKELEASIRKSLSIFADPGAVTPQQFNLWILNDLLAVNPMTRFLTSMIYKSEITGLSKVYYKQSHILTEVFKGETLFDEAVMPHVFHNAWKMPKNRNETGAIQIFHNRMHDPSFRNSGYKKITDESLCACSALPYIEESVPIDGDIYTEGALVDTVNFKNLLRDHPDLDEVWVNRIVDQSQVKAPRNLADSLANLPMQFAGEVGENDVKLFRQHLINQSWMRPRVVEIPIRPQTEVTFEWKHSNLVTGCEEGYDAVLKLLDSDDDLRQHTVD